MGRCRRVLAVFALIVAGGVFSHAQVADRNADYCLRLGADNILCKPSLLTQEQRVAANETARRINNDYRQRLGADNILCKPSLLTQEELTRAQTVGASAPTVAACAENGSCFGDISEATGRSKTVQVDGYYRKDGTYVRGHYRSAPSKGGSSSRRRK